MLNLFIISMIIGIPIILFYIGMWAMQKDLDIFMFMSFACSLAALIISISCIIVLIIAMFTNVSSIIPIIINYTNYHLDKQWLDYYIFF